MECPVPCDVCGELIPLDKAHFYTDYCDCRGEGCTHGVCDSCLEELDEEDEDDALDAKQVEADYQRDHEDNWRGD